MILIRALLTMVALLAPAASASAAPASRSFEATYFATVEEIPAGLNRLEVGVPLPQDTPAQRIRNLIVDCPDPRGVRPEKEFANAYYSCTTDQPRAGKLEIRGPLEAE